MITIGSLCLLPTILCALCVAGLSNAITRQIAVALLWTQFAIATKIVFPVISGESPACNFSDDFGLDVYGAVLLSLTNFVAACSFTQAAIYFNCKQKDRVTPNKDHEKSFYFFGALLLIAMNFVFISENMGLLWVSVEATTLCSATLVYHERNKHALEATWKYLIVCSVGIAFALFGTILFFAASQQTGFEGTLDIRILLERASTLDPKFLQLGYIFCLLGYGTKAGVFPLHTWLPDAHSEAPAAASALLSGSLLNCALFAICRLTELVMMTEHHVIASSVPIGWGALTALTASLLIIRQTGIKLLWAYSSMENVGIMMCAIGLGTPSLFVLMAVNHSLVKVALFLFSGNIIQTIGTKRINRIRGVLQISPACGLGVALCACAVTGIPPFGSFVAEWLILQSLVKKNELLAAAILFVAITMAFMGVGKHICYMLGGRAKSSTRTKIPFVSLMVPLILCLCSLLLGVSTLTQMLLEVL